MRIVHRQSALTCAALVFFTAQAVSKRTPPKPISPVVFDGIRSRIIRASKRRISA